MAESSSRSDHSDREPQGPSYAQIARRWSRLSTNLLASGLVVVLAVALIRYVAPWWQRDESVTPQVDVARSVGQSVATDDDQGVLTGFGQPALSLRHASYSGDREGAVQRLQQLCRRSASELSGKQRRTGPAERRVLELIDEATPVDVQHGHWRMYALNGPTPLIAVASWPARQAKQPIDAATPQLSKQVLSWGIAVPAGPAQWTLFVYPGSGRTGKSTRLSSRLKLPPGTSRTMSLGGENGAFMLAFAGQVDTALCRRHFDRWSHARGIARITDWRRQGRQWSARYGDPHDEWMDVHLLEAQGRLAAGFISVDSGPTGAGNR